jgi:hypothetical protein
VKRRSTQFRDRETGNRDQNNSDAWRLIPIPEVPISGIRGQEAGIGKYPMLDA